MSSRERDTNAPAVTSTARTEAEGEPTHQAASQTDKRFVVKKLERSHPIQHQSTGGIGSFDWRAQARQRPVTVSIGALCVGMIAGYSFGGALTKRGRRPASFRGYSATIPAPALKTIPTPSTKVIPAYTAEASRKVVSAPYEGSSQEQITTNATAPSTFDRSTLNETSETTRDYSRSDGNGYQDRLGAKARRKPRQESKLLARFKQTSAFDRLQVEMSRIGDQLIDELSNIGNNVVLPAVTGKINQLVGGGQSASQR